MRIEMLRAPGVGTQDANCEAPERTSPTSWRRHVHPPRNSFRAEFRYASAGRRKSGRESSGAARWLGAVERFAGAHPPHCVGPLLQGRGWPCLSIGLRPPGSLLHGYLIQTNGANPRHASARRRNSGRELRST